MRRLGRPLLLVVLLALVAVLAAGRAVAHSNGCHTARTCPSDHHTYVWYDGSGRGNDCAESGAAEYDPARDSATVSYGGQTYRCALVGASAPSPTPAPSSRCRAGRLPDRSCTPGGVLGSATVAQICSRGYASRVRAVSAATKRSVFARYGIASPPRGAYEVDHLVPLELGGSNSARNLWPEAASPAPGFHEKDRLENALHRRVCAGRMSLPRAQSLFEKDWVAAFRRYGGR